MSGSYRLQIGFFGVLIVGVAVLSFFVFKPYLSALFLAAVFAVVSLPLHRRILAFVGDRRNLGAAATLCVLIAVVLIPISVFLYFAFQDAESLYFSVIREGSAGTLARLTARIEALIAPLAPEVSIDVMSSAESILGRVVENAGGIFSGFFNVVVQFFLMLLALFYFIRDGGRFKEHLVFLSPLANRYDESILKRLGDAVNAVVRGSLLIALIQGVLAGIGFAIFGVPNPTLWGVVAAVSALIPSIGTSLVLVPAIIYLFVTGPLGMALGLLVWGVVAVGLVDNILQPILLERSLRVHPLLILLSVIGGITLMGPVGFLAGPVIIALLFALFDVYPLILGERGNAADSKGSLLS
jgi:predicted PurR-regulated permease PerM